MSRQNTSSAVMAQRIEPHDSLDFFPTPPWATRALCEHVLKAAGYRIDRQTVLDPACGEGHMARPLAEYFAVAYASDIHDYGFSKTDDFLFPGGDPGEDDWIITNPPFRLGAQFIEKALSTARVGVAMLVRTSFLEGIKRHAELFKPHPPEFIAQFTERVPMVKGRVDAKASSATAYCWITWRAAAAADREPPQFVWIPPCRKALEREGDYDDVSSFVPSNDAGKRDTAP